MLVFSVLNLTLNLKFTSTKIWGFFGVVFFWFKREAPVQTTTRRRIIDPELLACCTAVPFKSTQYSDCNFCPGSSEKVQRDAIQAQDLQKWTRQPSLKRSGMNVDILRFPGGIAFM